MPGRLRSSGKLVFEDIKLCNFVLYPEVLERTGCLMARLLALWSAIASDRTL
ncbi:hypothetical protein [Microcoleus sp. herbarium12]|uniref:hypothetical protein n=1 Tax=Microcoleus sp. herbarium12 TaxID=3055437 RepID=UPI002FD14863